MHHIYYRFRFLPLLTIAAMDGFALGGGAELTTWPDWRVLSEKGRIQFVQGRMGVTPGWGGGSRLTELLGPAKALKLLCGSAPITTENGTQIGFIDYTAKEKCAEQVAKEMLEGFLVNTHGSINTLRGFKNVILNAQQQRHDASLLAQERDIFTSLWGAKDNLKALARVQERKAKKT
jgi:ethylmalonyl-CoA/methylmalonyl-CoA decarboxylase